MITNKEAKKLWRTKTIDLKKIMYTEYLHSKKTKMEYIKDWAIKYIAPIWIILYLAISILSYGGLLHIWKANANEGQILSIKDKIRLERLETCQNAFDKWKEKKKYPFYIRKKLAVVSCAIRMHGVYIMESWKWKSKMCRTRNSCLWIKIKKNWYYGHNWFWSYREEREIFADKYFEFHYKKSPFTFVYWYKQTNWKYKWGWATWNRARYVELLNNVENDEKLIAEYDYLYNTWHSIDNE